MSHLHGALLALVLAGSLGAAVVGALAMPAWRHRAYRFVVTGLGCAACAAVAALAGAALLGGPRPEGWQAPLRLLADAMLPLVFVLLVLAYRRADRLAEKAYAAASVNPRSSLPNRATLIDLAAPAVARCQRDRAPVTLIAAAIDRHEEMTRPRGPAAVEETLRDFVALFREVTRAGDVPGHAAPGTLVALLPSASAEAARGMAERLRREAATRLSDPKFDGRRLSVSVGIAMLGDGPARAVLDEAIAAAEAALSTAQAAGGNRVLEAPAPPPRSAGLPA